MNHVPFDVIGNIALVKFKKSESAIGKKRFALSLLKQQKSIKTVLEKTGKFKGRLRKQSTKYVAGEKTKEALYKENGCTFRFNVDSSYFSPRLSSERFQIAKMIKRGESVLIMFAGVAPYPVVIAKNSKASVVYSNEINREANKYAELNIELNKLKGRVVLLPGDIKRIVKRLVSSPHHPTPKNIVNSRISFDSRLNIPKNFDTIVMPRPQLKDMFLKEAFLLSKKGTRIFYYDFCKEDEIPNLLERIKNEARKSKRKIKILRTKKAGEIAPYRYRVRVDFLVVN